jgi:UDP-glucose 4-epimerase
MKALVTGCAGFIGSHLVDKLLNEKFKVIGIDAFTNYYSRTIKERNIEDALKHKNFILIEKNILTMSNFPKVDFIFHEAAQPGVRASWGRSFEVYVQNNILVTQKLLEFYKDKEIKKFVFASSSSVYGNPVKMPIKEETTTKPISPYGVTKLACENLCYLYSENYNIPIVLLRYFTVYGPRQRPDMAIYKFIKGALQNEEITIFGDGNQTRDFTYISDVIEATLLAAKSNIINETFNIGGGTRISLNHLLKLIEDITGKEIKVKYLNFQKGDVYHTFADISKAREILGYKPKTSIEDGLKTQIEWMKKGKNLFEEIKSK